MGPPRLKQPLKRAWEMWPPWLKQNRATEPGRGRRFGNASTAVTPIEANWGENRKIQKHASSFRFGRQICHPHLPFPTITTTTITPSFSRFSRQIFYPRFPFPTIITTITTTTTTFFRGTTTQRQRTIWGDQNRPDLPNRPPVPPAGRFDRYT